MSKYLLPRNDSIVLLEMRGIIVHDNNTNKFIWEERDHLDQAEAQTFQLPLLLR